MKATQDSLRCYESKYNPSSALIIGLYGMNCLLQSSLLETLCPNKNNPYFENFTKVIPYLPCYLHIYHLGSSIYDRYHFDSRIDNALKFFKDEYYFEGNKYCITGAEKYYGFSIIDFISVIGLFTAMCSVIPTKGEMLSQYEFYLQKAKLYSTYAVFSLAAVDILFGSPDAYFEINYNISSPEIELFIDSEQGALAVYDDLDTTLESI